MKSSFAVSCAAAALVALSPAASFAGDAYAGFPVTLKGYGGDKKSSVSYSGQAARNVLHDSLKKLAKSGDAAAMTAYFEGKEAGRKIVAPASKGAFKIKQSDVDAISKGKNIAGKTYKGVITGMPGNMTGPELVTFWIAKAAAAPKGFDATHGYDYAQLISKFVMGAMNYNQAVDNYLDEKLSAAKNPNDKPYKEGAHYTGKEHIWDEAFGYFGAPAHALSLTPKQVYAIAKRKEDALKAADANGDGVVDLKTEMTFGPAYYAAGFDKGGKTQYLRTIVKAFLDGRKLIAAAKGEKLSDAERAKLVSYAAVIGENWEKVLAEATFKYAGSVYKDMEKLKVILDAKGDPKEAFRAYAKHWGELKGFSLALQTGKNNLGETAVKINRLVGFSPLLLNSSAVVDVDSKGEYERDQGLEWGEYMLHMAKLQNLMVEKFGVKAKSNAIGGELADLAKKLGAGASAEND